MPRQVYFDHYASTPVLPEVFEAMRPYFAESFGSPASLHQHGLRVRDALARAREQMAALIHAESPETILFTSGATESANLAVKGAAWATHRRGNHLIAGTTDHPAVLNSIEFLEKQGFECTRVGADAEGRIAPEEVRRAIKDETILLCLHHANHDIGAIQPVREIATLAAEAGVPVFLDASTSGGWLPIDVQELGVQMLSLAPHRFYGPKGVGVLYRNRRARITSLIHGGVQEEGRRAGTENVPGIAGAGIAAAIAARELSHRIEQISKLQRRLWQGLKGKVSYIRLNGPEPGALRLPTNLNLSAEFTEGEGQALLCDTHGIALGAGTSCVSRSIKVSHVLEAIGLDRSLAQAAVILSLGRDNTDADVDYFLEVFPKVISKLRTMSPLWDEFERGEIDSVIEPRGKRG